MKLRLKASDLDKATCILSETSRRLGWRVSNRVGELYKYDQELFIGAELRKAKTPNGRKLERIVKPPESWVAFFGYQCRDGRPVELAVWFYHSSNRQREKLKRLLKRKLKGRRYDVKPIPHEGRWYFLTVTTRRHSLNNDCDWFCSIFKALGLRIRS